MMARYGFTAHSRHGSRYWSMSDKSFPQLSDQEVKWFKVVKIRDLLHQQAFQRNFNWNELWTVHRSPAVARDFRDNNPTTLPLATWHTDAPQFAILRNEGTGNLEIVHCWENMDVFVPVPEKEALEARGIK